MKALKIIVIILVVILAIVLIPPLFMPSEMYIEETQTLTAQPEVVWEQVNCLENWEAWDLWHQDTNIVGHYEGPACGEGAKNVWTYKNRDDGGSQTIVESRPYEYIRTLLDFQQMGTAQSEFFFEPVDEGTKVTWNLRSEGGYPIMRWVNTLLVKPGVTKSYKEGLANLNELTMNMKPVAKYSTGEIMLKEVEPMNGLAVRAATDMEGMGAAMGASFGAIMAHINKNNLQMAGPPRAVWYKWDGQNFEFDNVIPIAAKAKGDGEIKSIETYGGNAIHTTHMGSYESTHHSWEALEKYMKANNFEPGGDPFEVYITDPQMEPDQSKWITELYWPVK